MTQPNQHSKEPSALGWVVALVLLFLPGITQSVLHGRALWGLALVQGVLLAVPFAYLGFTGTNARRPWLIAATLTAIFWGGPIAIAALVPDENMGLELLLGLTMVASPFIATTGAWLATRSTNRAES